MTDLPPGKWTALLVGHQWPASSAISTVDHATSQRSAASISLNAYAETIESVLTTSFAHQEGATADATRATFARGADAARSQADQQDSISRAYRASLQSGVQLRNDLAEIATRGNSEIEQIQSSANSSPLKLAKIVEVISSAQDDANRIAAIRCSDVLAELQTILGIRHVDVSAREFSRVNGMDLSEAFRSTGQASLREQAALLISESAESSSSELQLRSPSLFRSGENASNSLPVGSYDTGPLSNRYSAAQMPTAPDYVELSPGDLGTSPSLSIYAGGQNTRPVTNTATTLQPNTPISLTAPDSVISPTPPLPIREMHAAQANLPYSQPPSPTDFAHSLSTSSQAGAPISMGAESASPSGVHAAHQTPTHTSALAAAAVAPVNPMAASPEIAVAHAPIEPAAPPAVITAPQPTAPTVAPAPPPIAVATPTSTPGVLPAYGADLKAPAPTVPAAASPTPATPISAPLSGSANTLGQASVVRHQSSAPAATAAAPLTERAVAATATGSITGAAAAQATAQKRLNRLLASVARQAPELGWAVGDRDDQTTVLTTDLASGWIPPNIKIPRGVTVLEPAKRRGTLAGMLGATTLTAVHTPGQHVPPDNGDSPTFSTRPRRTADVEDLHWELTQATKWRDGLPRLAHTLARAIASGTGYLDSEVKILREALVEVANNASSSYPHTDADLIGNWQLLATIEALIEDEKTCANYHLAWFRTLSPKGSGN